MNAHTPHEYTGIGNLEAMEAAINYREYLAGLLRNVHLAASREEAIVLDFGAGVGTYAREARGMGYAVSCVEPDPQLQALLLAEGFKCYASSEEVSSDACDLVYSYNVLEHIADDRNALAELHRVLRAGGVLLLYVPAFNILFGPMDHLVGHLRRYRRRDLESLVKEAGFIVEHSGYADSLGFLVSLVYRLSRRSSGRIDARSVRLYDRFLFPVSRVLDRALSPFLGKNAVIVGRKVGGP